MAGTIHKDLPVRQRFPVLVIGMLSLILGIFTGLGYIGVRVPDFSQSLSHWHGLFMIPAFFGTVISLERAVALGKRWAYLSPLLSALGAVTLLVSAEFRLFSLAFVLSALLFTVVSFDVWRIQKEPQNAILLLGAFCLLAGNILLLRNGYALASVLWWASFLLLTIAGERLELSRLVIRSDKRKKALVALACIPPAGALLAGLTVNGGVTVFAAGMLGIAIWLLSSDIARRTVRMQGLTRFTAVCMLAGYVWLLASALFAFACAALPDAQDLKDPALHTFFLGFVFTMVMGHALLIFPAITQLHMPYSPIFYLPLLLLHGGLLVRVGGALAGDLVLRQWGALGNAIGMVVFLLFVLLTVIRGNLFAPASQAPEDERPKT